jgi:hypothetical protein
MFRKHFLKNWKSNANVAIWYGIFLAVIGSTLGWSLCGTFCFWCTCCFLDGISGYIKERKESPTKN